VITSAANPLIKRVRLLADRRHRRREGAFVVQGVQPVWQAVDAGAEIETLIVAPGLLRPTAAAEMVGREEARGTSVARISSELFTRIADRDGPTGLAAIVRFRPQPLAGLAAPAGSVFAALHAVANPGNLGAVIRTANAAQAGVILLGGGTDPYDPAAVKASMGALFTVPLAQAETADELFGWAAERGVRVTATSAHAVRSCWEAEFPLPQAILLGSEGPGLPGNLVDRSDLSVRIPMAGTAESLNLAVAAGIMLFEVRRRHGLTERNLPPAPPVAPASGT
jgi:TrmH family RNA methyltransferase